MDKYKEEIKKCINDLKSKKTFYKQIPNLITLIRIIGIIPMNILYLTGNIPGAIALATIIFLSDFIDGKIARKYNITSSFGADLDAVSDKALALGLCIPLMINNPLLIFNMILEIMIGSVNVFSKYKGYEPKSNYIGKIKTWFLSITLLFGYLKEIFPISNLILYISIILTTILQGVTFDRYILSTTFSESNLQDKEYNNKSIKSKTKELDSNNKEQELKQEEISQLEYLKRERQILLDTKLPDKFNKYTKSKKR